MRLLPKSTAMIAVASVSLLLAGCTSAAAYTSLASEPEASTEAPVAADGLPAELASDGYSDAGSGIAWKWAEGTCGANEPFGCVSVNVASYAACENGVRMTVHALDSSGTTLDDVTSYSGYGTFANGDRVTMVFAAPVEAVKTFEFESASCAAEFHGTTTGGVPPVGSGITWPSLPALPSSGTGAGSSLDSGSGSSLDSGSLSGGGYPVICGDGSLSSSGGIQGACSHHGGVSG